MSRYLKKLSLLCSLVMVVLTGCELQNNGNGQSDLADPVITNVIDVTNVVINHLTNEYENFVVEVSSNAYSCEGDIMIDRLAFNKLKITNSAYLKDSSQQSNITKGNVFNFVGLPLYWVDGFGALVNRFSPSEQKNLRYTFEGDFTTGTLSDEYVKDLCRKAFRRWEAVADIKFVEVASDPVFRVISVAKPEDSVYYEPNNLTFGLIKMLSASVYNAPANATFPGIPGQRMEYHPYITTPGKYDAVKLEAVFLHETGHILGLAHEHQRADASVNPEQWNLGLAFSYYDAESVMNYNGSLHASDSNIVKASHFNRLSAEDIYTISELYGAGPDCYARSLIFDSQYYFDTWSDLPDRLGGYNSAGYRQGIKHFFTVGLKSEGRKSAPWFDVKYYVEHNVDLAAGFGTDYARAARHWIEYGIAEKRRASETFDVNFYKEHNSDLSNEFYPYNLLVHYMTNGYESGRIGYMEIDGVSYYPSFTNANLVTFSWGVKPAGLPSGITYEIYVDGALKKSVTDQYTASLNITDGDHKFYIKATKTYGDYTRKFSLQSVEQDIHIGPNPFDAKFWYTVVPAKFLAGHQSVFSFVMLNKGNVSWSENDVLHCRLGLEGGISAFTGLNRLLLTSGTTVGYGASYTYQVPVTAPAVPGTYTFDAQMVNEGDRWFGERKTFTVNVAENTNYGAQIVEDNIPNVMVGGQSYQVSVSVKNTGETPWTENSAFRLGIVNGASFLGANRIQLDSSEVISNGTVRKFTFTMKAPYMPGTYNGLSIQMLQENVKWFGDCLTKRIIVTSGSAVSARFNGDSIPSVMNAGQTYEVAVGFKNSGSANWNFNNGSYLAVVGDTERFGLISGRMGIDRNGTVPEGFIIRVFSMTAPATPGFYHIEFQMQGGDNTWFGDRISKSIQVF